MHTWRTELVKELKTVSKGQKEAGQTPEILDDLIGKLETVACDEAQVVDRLSLLGLNWFARKVEALDFHQKARALNQQDEAQTTDHE